LPHNNDAYLRDMRFSMKEHSLAYQPKVRAITRAGSAATPQATVQNRVPSPDRPFRMPCLRPSLLYHLFSGVPGANALA